MKPVWILMLSVGLTACDTVRTVSPELTNMARLLGGDKIYRVESVEGEPDQRLIIVNATELAHRLEYKRQAVNEVCPAGTQADVLAEKDYPAKKEYKVVVWCQK